MMNGHGQLGPSSGRHSNGHHVVLPRIIPGEQPFKSTGGHIIRKKFRLAEETAQSQQSAPIIDSHTNFINGLCPWKVDCRSIFHDLPNNHVFSGIFCNSTTPASAEAFGREDFKYLGLCDVLQLPYNYRYTCGWSLQRFFKFQIFFLSVKKFNFRNLRREIISSTEVLQSVNKRVMEELASTDSSIDEEVFIKKGLVRFGVIAANYFRQMSADMSKWVLTIFGWFLIKFLSSTFFSLVVNRGQIAQLKLAAERGVPLIYVPIHRSHVDYLIISLITFQYELCWPHIAAGENLSQIPFVSWFLRKMGAFYIRRSVGGPKTISLPDDNIYKTVLTKYLEALLKCGYSLEFFMEGGRSRLGKSVVPPKYGLLSLVVNSVAQREIVDACIVPVGISYDASIDFPFTSEWLGEPKKKESLVGFLSTFWKCWQQKFGMIRVDFAQPFSIKEFLENSLVTGSKKAAMSCNVSRSNDSLPDIEAAHNNQIELVRDLGQCAMYQAQQCSSVMSTHILCFLLLTRYREGVTLSKLVLDFDRMRTEFLSIKRDVGFSGTSFLAVEYACYLLGSERVSLILPTGKSVTSVRDSTSGLINLNITLTPNLCIPVCFDLYYLSNCASVSFASESVVLTVCMSLAGMSFTTLYMQHKSPLSEHKILQESLELADILANEYIFCLPSTSLSDHFTHILRGKLLLMDILASETENTDQNALISASERKIAQRIADRLGFESDDEDYENFQENDKLSVCSSILVLNPENEGVRDSIRGYAMIVAPIIEAYWFAANFLTILVDTGGSCLEKEFFKELSAYTCGKHSAGLASFPESSCSELLKNAISAFKRMNILTTYLASGTSDLVIGLTGEYNNKRAVFKLVDLLDKFKL